jgi:hypothetical protein
MLACIILVSPFLLLSLAGLAVETPAIIASIRSERGQ